MQAKVVIGILISLLLAAEASGGAASGQSHVVFTPGAKEGVIQLGPYLRFFEDENGIYSIKDIAKFSQEPGKFQRIESASKGFGFTSSIYWVHFRIDFSQYDEPYWYLIQDYEHISYLTLFYPSESGSGYEQMELGTNVSIEKRPYKLRNLVYRVPTPAVETADYYIRVDGEGKWTLVDLGWADDIGLAESISTTQMFFGLFFGGLFVMMVYNLFLYLSLRDRTYLYYVIYLFCFIASYFHINGYTYLVFDLPPGAGSKFGFFYHGTFLGILLTVRSFFNLREVFPRTDRVLKVVQYIVLGLAISSLIFLSEGLSANLVVIMTILFTPALFVLAIMRFRQGLDAALYFLSGWAVWSISGMAFGLQALAIIPSNALTTHGLQVGAVAEAVLFALALAKRTKDFKEARDKAVAETIENRKLSDMLDKAVENERKLISQELHDNLNPNLLTIKLSSRKIAKLAASGNGVMREISELSNQISRIVVDSFSATRNLIKRLRPENLDVLGLEGALNELVENYNASSEGCVYEYDVSGNVRYVDEDKTIAIYRIAQEALANVAKHSSATLVQVKLKATPNNLYFQILDNGRGFDKLNLKSRGIGLISMRERALRVGGAFDIESTPQGTSIQVSIPLTEQTERQLDYST